MTTPAPVPYIAPWATQWNRYAVQFFNLASVTATQRSVTVPSGQWWRPLYVQTILNSDATLGTRNVILAYAIAGSRTLTLSACATQAPSVVGTYAFFPGAGAFEADPSGTADFYEQPTPDILIPQGSKIIVSVQPILGADALSSQSFVAVEIYTEQRDDNTGAVTLVPTPVLG